MADAEASILISAEGSGAIEALGNVSDAIDGMGESFKHVGVHIFGEQLLHMAGVTGHIRPLMMALQASVTGLTTAFGAGASALFPYVAIAAGAAAIIYKLVNAHHDDSAALAEHVKTLESDLASTRKLSDAIEEYGKSVGDVPSKLADLEKANNALYQSQVALLKLDLAKKIEEDTKKLGEMGEGLGKGKWMGDMASTLQAQEIEFYKLDTEIKKMTADLDSLNKTGKLAVDSMKDQTAAAKQRSQEMEESGNRVAAVLMFENSQWRKLQSDIAAYNAKFKADAQQAAQQTAQAWQSNLAPVANAIGQAFAQAAFTGKSALKSLEQSFIQMAEQMMAKLIGLITLWAILDILSGGAAAGGGGSGPAGGMSGPGSLSGFLKKGFGFATGVDTYVDRPTPFVAGEAGMERVSVTPAGGGGSPPGGGGGDIHVGGVSVTVQGVQDPNAIAAQVGQAIIRQIRGMGQLNFQRGS